MADEAENKMGDLSLEETEGKGEEKVAEEKAVEEKVVDDAAAPVPVPSPTPAPADTSTSWMQDDEDLPDVVINGKSYKSLADGQYDAIIMSTGLKECLLAGLLAVRGLKVLQIDRNPYYGGACASLNLQELYQHFGKPFDEANVTQRFGNSRRYCVDLVPKLLMANGKLVKMLLQTGVTRYIDFVGIDGSYVLNSGKIYKVPVTPAEALKTSLVGFFQKRNLKNFAEFVGKWTPPDRSWERRINSYTEDEFRLAIAKYYEEHNPSKMTELDAVITKYEQHRPFLVVALEDKYGLPVFPVTRTHSFEEGSLGLRIANNIPGTGEGTIKNVVHVIGFGDNADGTKGQAEMAGWIQPGDILCEIAGENFIGRTDKDVIAKLGSSPRPLEIKFIKAREIHAAYSADGDQHRENDYSRVTMREVYDRFGLDENSQNFIGHAMALQTDDKYLDEPAEEILEAVRLYGRSMGLYGQDSPYLYPMYGLSSLPEGFSRLAAIYGGTVMLRTDVDEVLFDSEGKAVGVRSGDRAATATHLIGDASFFPREKSHTTGKIVRSICLLKHPVPKTSGESAQIILPSKHIKGKTQDVYVSELGQNLQVCGKGTYLAMASTTVETDNPIAELEPAFKLMGPIEERFDSVVPSVSPVGNGRADNCYITSSLDATSHFESAALDVMNIYHHIFNKPLDLTEKLVETPSQ